MAELYTEVAMQRPVQLDEVRRWAELHDLPAARAFRGLGRTETIFNAIAARVSERVSDPRAAAQLQALQTPWTCAGGAARSYSTIALERGGRDALLVAATGGTLDGTPTLSRDEAAIRLGAVYAAALATVVSAQDAVRRLADKLAARRDETAWPIRRCWRCTPVRSSA